MCWDKMCWYELTCTFVWAFASLVTRISAVLLPSLNRIVFYFQKHCAHVVLFISKHSSDPVTVDATIWFHRTLPQSPANPSNNPPPLPPSATQTHTWFHRVIPTTISPILNILLCFPRPHTKANVSMGFLPFCFFTCDKHRTSKQARHKADSVRCVLK